MKDPSSLYIPQSTINTKTQPKPLSAGFVDNTAVILNE
jgi:hypothetical protein